MSRSPQPDPIAANGNASARLDRWLWTVRCFKTRALAAAACRAGAISVGAGVAKPSREVRVGETVIWRDGLVERILIVRGQPRARESARVVADFCEETTPPAAWAPVRGQQVAQFLARDKGAGRPTKRDRRVMDRWFE